MRNYFVFLNGCIVADFMQYGRALNYFRRRMLSIDADHEIIELYDRAGHRYASSI